MEDTLAVKRKGICVARMCPHRLPFLEDALQKESGGHSTSCLQMKGLCVQSTPPR